MAGKLVAAPIMLLVALSILCFGSRPLLAGSYGADGAYVGTPSPAVTALFAANPNGGDALVAAVRALLIANPALADDVSYVAARSSAGQQSAAAAGMAQAFTILSNQGNTSGASRILGAAQQSGSTVIQTALVNVMSATAVFANQTSNPVTGQSNCRPSVSPSAPSTCP